MNRRTTFALSTMVLLSSGFALPGATVAQRAQFGTAEEAKSMLAKTVAAVKADKPKTLDMIAKGEGGFLDRDLYPFCANVSDGKIHPFPNPDARHSLEWTIGALRTRPARRLVLN